MEEKFIPAKYIKRNGEVIDFTGLYEVSNLARVKFFNYNKTKGKELIVDYSHRKQDYINIALRKDGKEFKCGLHRLVLSSFEPNSDTYDDVNHKDENKHNNSLNNLEWCSRKYNLNYGSAKDRIKFSQPNTKRIKQLDLNGNIIKVWSSLREIERETGYLRQHINDACLNRRNVKTAYKYKWEYA